MSTLPQLQTLIDAIGTGEKNTAEEMRAILNALSTSVYVTGDIKEVDCTTAYVLVNFDPSGLGINERVGWAICNGLNGTKNRVGKTSIGYGDTYPTMGATGGSKDAVVVAHNHSYSQYVQSGSNDGSGGEAAGYFQTGTTSTAGESGTNKNMQPYIVTLMIQKL